MRTTRTAVAAATIAAAGVAGTAPASAKLTKPRFKKNTQVCLDLGHRTARHTAFTQELPSNIKRFGNLKAGFDLMLTLRGTYKFVTRHDTNNTPLHTEGLLPQRFALEGAGHARVRRHPKKKGPLLSRTTATFHSTETGVSWSFGPSVSAEGVGLGIGVTPTKSEHTEAVTGTGSTPRGRTVNSFVAEGDNAVSGAAGKSSGLDKITLQGFVIVGHDQNTYRTSRKSWTVQDVYQSPANNKEIPNLEPCDPAINFNP